MPRKKLIGVAKLASHDATRPKRVPPPPASVAGADGSALGASRRHRHGSAEGGDRGLARGGRAGGTRAGRDRSEIAGMDTQTEDPLRKNAKPGNPASRPAEQVL